MKLKEFTVREFQSVWDSGPIKIDERVTALVGKNEAGKTALLKALYRSNPLISAHAKFDETYDYPKREVEDYRFEVESGEREEVAVVSCIFELNESDKNAVAEIFGKSTLKGNEFKRNTYYGENNSKFSILVKDEEARKHLSRNTNLPQALRKDLAAASDWDKFQKILEESEETESVKELKQLVAQIVKNGLEYYIFNSIIWPRAPKFLYFDEYYQMKGQANLDALIQREDAGDLDEPDYPLLGLISLARLNHRQLVATKNTQELKNKLEGAGNYLTRRIMKYWSQNRHIKMEFDVRDAKPEDPQGMREGINVWGEVYDTVHWAHTPLSSRSRGFVWFFSFLAWYEDIKRKEQDLILLLDEPGLSLHGRAQMDLLRYFDEELTRHQMIYSTHSPFMVDPTRFERVRIVQDLSIDTDEPLSRELDGTKVLSNVFDATDDSLFPLQGALGYEIHQTLFIGPDSLVVEGPSDMLFLRSVSAELQRQGRQGLSDRWIITPVGGSAKVPTFVALLAPQKGLNVATLLDIQKKDQQMIEDLYKKKLLDKKQVVTYAEFLRQKEADIEDIFDPEFYVGIVNKEFAKELRAPVKIADLNPKIPRIDRKLEEYFEKNSMKSGAFSHYRPARYFSENVGELWPKIGEETVERFEAVFDRLNGLLK